VPRAEPEPEPVEAGEEGQLALFAELPTAPLPLGYRLPELVTPDPPPLHRVRRLSYSALALFERCSYRYYAERVAGLREERGGGTGGTGGLAATEIGDAVHRLLESDRSTSTLCAAGTRRRQTTSSSGSRHLSGRTTSPSSRHASPNSRG
jgi:ATP-dependent nuclease, subunit B